MRETQQTISEWAEATFGPAGTHFSVATRANEEMAELLRRLDFSGSGEQVVEEAADVCIVLSRLAVRAGYEWTPPAYSGLRMHPEWIAARASIQLGHVICQLSMGGEFTGDSVAHLRECLDCLYYLCRALGTTLEAEIDRKMAINRQREWRLDGTGHGYHVAAEASRRARRLPPQPRASDRSYSAHR